MKAWMALKGQRIQWVILGTWSDKVSGMVADAVRDGCEVFSIEPGDAMLALHAQWTTDKVVKESEDMLAEVEREIGYAEQ